MRTALRSIRTMPWFGRPPEIRAYFREKVVPIAAKMLDGFVAESLKVPAHVWRAGFIGDDFSPRLREIKVPTLIVWGRHDAFCSAIDQQAMLGLIRSARLVEYADAGHAVHWEEPQRFARDLSRLRHLGRRRRGDRLNLEDLTMTVLIDTLGHPVSGATAAAIDHYERPRTNCAA